MDIKYFLGMLLYIIHYSFNFFILFLLFYTDNFYIIISIIVLAFLLLFSWYLANDCLLLSLENYLFNKKNKYPNNYDKYISFKLFDREFQIFYHVLYSYHIYLIFLIFFLSIIKIIYIYKNKKYRENKKYSKYI